MMIMLATLLGSLGSDRPFNSRHLSDSICRVFWKNDGDVAAGGSTLVTIGASGHIELVNKNCRSLDAEASFINRRMCVVE